MNYYPYESGLLTIAVFYLGNPKHKKNIKFKRIKQDNIIDCTNYFPMKLLIKKESIGQKEQMVIMVYYKEEVLSEFFIDLESFYIKKNVIESTSPKFKLNVLIFFKRNSSSYLKIGDFPRFTIDFEFISFLGIGSNSRVYLVKDKKNDLHALKTTSKTINIFKFDDTNLREILPYIVIEQHPCIIRLDGYVIDHQQNLSLVLEYAPNSSLENMLKREESGEKIKGWDATSKTILLYGICWAMSVFHQNKLIHCDISPHNILLDAKFRCKLCDFGVVSLGPELSDKFVGHYEYMSEEMKSYKDYTYGTDVASFGYILLKMAKIAEDDFLIGFASILTELESEDRISFSEICTLIESRIVYFKGAKFNEIEQYITDADFDSDLICDRSINLLISYLYKYDPIRIIDVMKLSNLLLFYDQSKLFDIAVVLFDGVAFEPKNTLYCLLDSRLMYYIKYFISQYLTHEVLSYYKIKFIAKIMALYVEILSNT